MRKLKTHCVHGHLLTPQNLYGGRLRCKTCHNIATKKSSRKHRGKSLKEKKLEKLCIRIEKLTRTNAIIRQSWWDLDLKFYRASYLKEIDIGAYYRAEILASQNGRIKALPNNDQAFGRRLSA